MYIYLMRERRANDVKLGPLANVRDAPLHSLPKHVRALLLVGLVLGRSRREVLPLLVGLAAGGVDVDGVLSRRADAVNRKV